MFLGILMVRSLPALWLVGFMMRFSLDVRYITKEMKGGAGWKDIGKVVIMQVRHEAVYYLGGYRWPEKNH